MDILRKYAILLPIIVLFFTACTNDEEGIDNMDYLYVPEIISINDSANITIVSEYFYDGLYRVEAIRDSFVASLINGENIYTYRDSTYSELIYDEAGNIIRMDIDRGYRIEDEPRQQTLIRYTFNYYEDEITGNQTVKMTETVQDIAPDVIYTLTLNEKQQVVKYENDFSGEYMEYEYDNNGNISQITLKNGKEFYYISDSKRGLFRDVNLPDWVITVVLDLQRSTRAASMNLNHNFSHNCETVYAQDLSNTNADGRVIYKEFLNTYNSFGYLLSSEDSNMRFKATISYSRR